MQSPSRVVKEIKYFTKKYGIKEVRFWDDNFIHSKKWVFEFCDLLEKENLGIIWGCHARVNKVTPNILKRIKKAGCWQVFYGIESGNQDLLNKINKGITLKQARKAVKWAKEAGLEVRNAFILGLPGETPAKTDKTIKFAKELNADITQFSLATPYPGTRMYEEVKNSKRLDKDLRKYSEYKVVYLPKGYKSKKQLEQKFRKAYREIYLTPSFFLRNLKKIKNTDDIKRYFHGFLMLLGVGFGKRKEG